MKTSSNKIILILSLFFSTITTCFAQNGIIRGKITDEETKELENISVILLGTEMGSQTDKNGNYKIINIKEGTYILRITAVGYTSFEKLITIKEDQEIIENFSIATKTEELSEVVIIKNNIQLVEKTATTSRLNHNLIEVPQNIVVITKQTISDVGALTKNDLLRTVSGITKTYGDNLDTSLLIRGTDATYGSFRNGVGGPVWWNAQEDASMIEQIEFVKGPAGFMLANSEPGGFINIVTKQPIHNRINEFSLGHGSFNMIRITADLGGEFAKFKKITYRLNIGKQQNAEFYKFGSFERIFIAPVVKYEFDENTNVTLEHNFVKAVTGMNEHQQISINKKFFTLPIEMSMSDPNIGTFLGADTYTRIALQHIINKKWTLNAQVAEMTSDWDGYTLNVSGLNATKDTIYRKNSKRDWEGKLQNAQLFLEGQFNTGNKLNHKVLFGLDYGNGKDGSISARDDSNSERLKLSISNPIYYVNKDSLQKIPQENYYSFYSLNRWQALYLQDHLKFGKKLIVTLAGRYTQLITGDDNNSGVENSEYVIKENVFTPRFGITYLFSELISVFALYDKSFLPQKGQVFGEGRLKPLNGSNTEFGFKGFFLNKKLMINTSLFNIIKNNVATNDLINIGYYIQNGQITSTGLEIDALGKINENISVNVNFSFINARITKDEDTSLIGIKNFGTPNIALNTFFKYKINSGVLKGIGLSVGSQYMGERSCIYPVSGFNIGNKSLPTFNLFDTSISYTHKGINIGLNIYNLTNVKYISNGYYDPDQDEYFYSPGAPINFRLQTTFRL